MALPNALQVISSVPQGWSGPFEASSAPMARGSGFWGWGFKGKRGVGRAIPGHEKRRQSRRPRSRATHSSDCSARWIEAMGGADRWISSFHGRVDVWWLGASRPVAPTVDSPAPNRRQERGVGASIRATRRVVPVVSPGAVRGPGPPFAARGANDVEARLGPCQRVDDCSEQQCASPPVVGLDA